MELCMLRGWCGRRSASGFKWEWGMISLALVILFLCLKHVKLWGRRVIATGLCLRRPACCGEQIYVPRPLQMK